MDDLYVQLARGIDAIESKLREAKPIEAAVPIGDDILHFGKCGTEYCQKWRIMWNDKPLVDQSILFRIKGAEHLYRLICEVYAQQESFSKRLEDAVKLLESLKAAMK